MDIHHGILLFLASAVASALNAVAGGGSFISFPALLFTGVAPVPANATNTLALWFGSAASGGAYRSRLNISRRVFIPLVVTGIIGGFLGALLLIKTPASTFLRVLPWLLLGATLLFTFGKRLTRRIAVQVSHDTSTQTLVGASICELLVAIYGGYFGGGIGIMNLAMFAAMGMTDVHEMNALKTVVVSIINGVAMVTFIVTGAILWPQAIVMSIGAILGGYLGAHYAMKAPQHWIRIIVIAVGFSMTAYFFYRGYS